MKIYKELHIINIDYEIQWGKLSLWGCKKKAKNQRISNMLLNLSSSQSQNLDSIPFNENFIT